MGGACTREAPIYASRERNMAVRTTAPAASTSSSSFSPIPTDAPGVVSRGSALITAAVPPVDLPDVFGNDRASTSAIDPNLIAGNSASDLTTMGIDLDIDVNTILSTRELTHRLVATALRYEHARENEAKDAELPANDSIAVASSSQGASRIAALSADRLERLLREHLRLAQEVMTMFVTRLQAQQCKPHHMEKAVELACVAMDEPLLPVQLLVQIVDRIANDKLSQREHLHGLGVVLHSCAPEARDNLHAHHLAGTLQVIHEHLETKMHYQPSKASNAEHHLVALEALARVLDAMVDVGVEGVEREKTHEKLYNLLGVRYIITRPERLWTDTVPDSDRLAYTAHYCRQALVRVPNDESNIRCSVRKMIAAGRGLAALWSAVREQKPGELLEAFTRFREVAYRQVDAEPWYDAIRYAEVLLESRNFAAFEYFLKNNQEHAEPMFLLGCIRLLEQAATAPVPSSPLGVQTSAHARDPATSVLERSIAIPPPLDAHQRSACVRLIGSFFQHHDKWLAGRSFSTRVRHATSFDGIDFGLEAFARIQHLAFDGHPSVRSAARSLLEDWQANPDLFVNNQQRKLGQSIDLAILKVKKVRPQPLKMELELMHQVREKRMWNSQLAAFVTSASAASTNIITSAGPAAAVQAATSPTQDAPATSSSSALQAHPAAIPNLQYRVPRPGFQFIGRTSVLARLCEMLTSNSTRCVPGASGPRVVVCHGVGGIGKTQLLAAFARAASVYLRTDQVTFVAWLPAETAIGLADACMQLAAELGYDGKDAEEARKHITATLAHRASAGHRWLFVLDNAESFEVIRPYIPLTADGFCLVSTRSSTGWDPSWQTLAIEPMDSIDGARLVRSFVPLDTPGAVVEQLVERLGCLPLALSEAGAFMVQTGWTVQEYLAVLVDSQATSFSSQQPSSCLASSRVTWSRTFETVRRTHPRALEILLVCGYCASERIPIMMLEAWWKTKTEPLPDSVRVKPALLTRLSSAVRVSASTNTKSSGGDVASGVVDAASSSFTESLAVLFQFALAKPSADATITVHRLVQDAVREEHSTIVASANTHRQKHSIWFAEVATTMAALFDDFRATPQFDSARRILLLHANCLLDHLRLWSANDVPPESRLSLARLLQNIGRFEVLEHPANAKARLTEALRYFEQEYGSDHCEIVGTLDSLGIAYSELGDSSSAKKLFERALVIQECHHGPDHYKTAAALAHLGLVDRELGDTARLKELFERVLVIQERHYGPDHYAVKNTLVNLGIAERNLGDVARGKELFERALVIEERHYGTDHVELAVTLVNLGLAYRDLGDAARAKELIERALVIKERHYGTDHAQLAGTLVDLGNICRALGDAARAKELLERALVIRKRHYGPHHFLVALPLVSLGKAYGALGDTGRKKQLIELALAIEENHYGPHHYQLKHTLFNLGELYREAGDAARAKELLQRHLVIEERHYGPVHRALVYTLHALAGACQDLGQANRAAALLKRRANILARD